MPNIEQLLATSRLAFLNQQNETALELANQAIGLDGKNPDAYKCAANALMSLERYDEAIKNYRMAVKYDPANGNRYFDLGFAQATNEKLADALKSLAKADELGCIPENLAQLYTLLGIICFDIGRYDDALINLGKAEQLVGVNLDILQRKAIIYGLKNEVRNGLQVTNQIKLVTPSEYLGYQMAFKLLIQGKRLDVAKTELQKAAKYAKPTMDFYFDQLTLELEHHKLDKDPVHFRKGLEIIEAALQNLEPKATEVLECYINAAELYLQLENADKTVECLQAAQAPVEAFNNRFPIIDPVLTPPVELDEYAVEEMLEAEREKMETELGEYGLEELFENTEPNEEGEREFFTELDEEETASEETVYRLDENQSYEMSAEHEDQINRLYVGAYTLKKDFEKVIEYARILQAGDGPQNIYIGKYTEANAYKEMGSPEAERKYDETIRFFRNAMIKDPTDMVAVTFRIQCCIDIGRYEEAEQICNLLVKEVRETFLEKIEEAKAGGE